MKKLVVFVFCFAALVVACRSEGPTLPLEPQDAVESQAGTDDVDATSDSGPFDDSEPLRLGRLILVNHLINIEGITAVPLPNDWQPVNMSEDETQQTFLFASADWQLQMVQPKDGAGSILYFAELMGPDDFLYAAEIHREGLVYPAQ